MGTLFCNIILWANFLFQNKTDPADSSLMYQI